MRIVVAFAAALLAIGAVTAASLRSLSARRDWSRWIVRTLQSNAAALPGSWDPDRVAQLVSNLVSNALQYGAPDAPVTVSLSRDAAGALEIRVHNQGPAIAAGLREHLFEPHRRGQGAENAHPRGLGLGLFIVREIARAHGGSVDVRSDAEGTTFAVSLPDAGPPAAAGEVNGESQAMATGLPAA